MAGYKGVSFVQTVLRNALSMIGSSANATGSSVFSLVDAELAKLFEDRNVLLTDGGLITFTGTQVQFSENLNLSVNSRIAGGSPVVISLGHANISLSNGDMWYAVINRTAGTASTFIVSSSTGLPQVNSSNEEVFLLIKRVDAGDGTERVYFRSGFAMDAGQTLRLGSGGSSSTASFNWVSQASPLSQGASSASFVFATPQPDTSYVIFAMMENETDSNPQFQQAEITAKSKTGFTASWNVPLDTNNYVLSYIIPPNSLVYYELGLSGSTSLVAATNPVPQPSSIYPAIVFSQNTADANPQFQTFLVGGKSSPTLNINWNAPTATSNYKAAFFLNGNMQQSINSGVNSASFNLPVSYGSTAHYAVIAGWTNTVDTNSKFQPLLVTTKNPSNFTISWPENTDTANYQLVCFAISLTT